MKKSKSELAKRIDHTLLKPEATPEQIDQLCLEAKQYGFYSVCVNSQYVSMAKDRLSGSDVKVCAVVGFPLGAMSTLAKVHEARLATQDGADEIDMVMWIGGLKTRLGFAEAVKEDIKKVVKVCHKHGVVCKVIIEACLLTNEEKIRACYIACEAGADFVQTSTGFSTSGATLEDVKLMKWAIQNRAKIKAAGDIKTYQQAMDMIEAGADRLGMSVSVKVMEEEMPRFGGTSLFSVHLRPRQQLGVHGGVKYNVAKGGLQQNITEY